MTDVLQRVLDEEPPPFALIHRPCAGTDSVDILVGDVTFPPRVADLPLRSSDHSGHDLLTVIPYRQIGERGFAHHDDGTPLIAMSIDESTSITPELLAELLPDEPIPLLENGFDIADEEYGETVRRVLDDEIGRGEGSNFVLSRIYRGKIENYATVHALSLFRRLLQQENGSYWTFIVHTGRRTFVGASPERHLSVDAGAVVMNPISGTYRYPRGGPSLAGVRAFLDDRKESDELYMVLDEELKMMARICERGGSVVGPFLKEMANLAHTEYLIEGNTRRDVRDLLTETMFAPTVVGSPLESACRMISRYETEGRGYYSGAVALLGRDGDGFRSLDSAINIRTVDIDRTGQLRLQVGGTIVRHSIPEEEVAETRAKAAGVLAAMRRPTASSSVARPGGYASHPSVRDALQKRKSGLSRFWLGPLSQRAPSAVSPRKKALILDAEDTFTAMLAQQLQALGLTVTVRSCTDDVSIDEFALTVLGPGPGAPDAADDPRVRQLRAAVRHLLMTGQPFLATCLSHQVLSNFLGLSLARNSVPKQGVQRQVDMFGRQVRAGFYNSFSAYYGLQERYSSSPPRRVEVARDADTSEVYALRGPAFWSTQFHPESVLTENGPELIAEMIEWAERDRQPPRRYRRLSLKSTVDSNPER